MIIVAKEGKIIHRQASAWVIGADKKLISVLLLTNLLTWMLMTGMDVASDAWVDLVDDLGCDCSKVSGYPVWANAPVDVSHLMGKEMVFHHRLTSDVCNYDLAGGGIIYVYVTPDGSEGAILWQVSGGCVERPHSHY